MSTSSDNVSDYKSSSDEEVKQQVRRSTKGILKWSPEEDSWLETHVELYGPKKWNQVGQELGRTPGSCRLRWCNQLDPIINRSRFTPEENELIIREVITRGQKWTQIAKLMHGRTDNQIKNQWNSKLKMLYQERQAQPPNRRNTSSVLATLPTARGATASSGRTDLPGVHHKKPRKNK